LTADHASGEQILHLQAGSQTVHTQSRKKIMQVLKISTGQMIMQHPKHNDAVYRTP